jgi:hypothetical protein
VHTVFWWGDMMERDILEYMGRGRIILKWIFTNWNGEAWTGLLWLGTGGGLL